MTHYNPQSYADAMSDPALNIYARCRMRHGMSQETWAEQLDVSVDSIRRYESGLRVPSNAMVAAMVTVSGDEMLAYQHLLRTSGILGILPGIDETTLQQATIQLINSVLHWADGRRDRQLLQIAADGRIAPDERPLFREILGELREIARTYYQLRFCPEAGEEDRGA